MDKRNSFSSPGRHMHMLPYELRCLIVNSLVFAQKSEEANDAEASSSKLPTNDAKGILKLLKDASEKVVTAKGLYDSSTDETKKHVEICQAVVGIQSKLSQFMVNSDETISTGCPMDFEGPSFSIGLTQELERETENGTDVPLQDVGTNTHSGVAFSSYDLGKEKETATNRHALQYSRKGKTPVIALLE
ncbi:hypothetical protein QQ045_000086 [Rhodiola kirilowii]